MSRNPQKLDGLPIWASGPVRGVADTSDRTGRRGRIPDIPTVVCVCVASFYVPILGNQCTFPGFHQGWVAVQGQLSDVRLGLAWQATSRCTDVRSRSVQTSGDIICLAIVLSVVTSLESARNAPRRGALHMYRTARMFGL